MKLYEVRIGTDDGLKSFWFATLAMAKERNECYILGRSSSIHKDPPWPELLAHDVVRETKATSLMCILLNGNVDHLITSTTVLFRHEPRTKAGEGQEVEA